MQSLSHTPQFFILPFSTLFRSLPIGESARFRHHLPPHCSGFATFCSSSSRNSEREPLPSRRPCYEAVMGPVYGSPSFFGKISHIRHTLNKSGRSAASGLQVKRARLEVSID